MTDLEAVNRALTLIAVEPIGSLADHTKAARIMSALLLDCKKVVLNEFPWSFAMRIEPLSGKGPGMGGYQNTFAYPAGALSVYRVYGDTDFRGVAEFRVLGERIATNLDSGSVEYTAFIPDIGVWPRQIAECLVNRLASDAATSLAGSPQLAITLLEKYTKLAGIAAQTSVVEENVPPARNSDYVNARR